MVYPMIDRVSSTSLVRILLCCLVNHWSQPDPMNHGLWSTHHQKWVLNTAWHTASIDPLKIIKHQGSSLHRFTSGLKSIVPVLVSLWATGRTSRARCSTADRVWPRPSSGRGSRWDQKMRMGRSWDQSTRFHHDIPWRFPWRFRVETWDFTTLW